MNLILQALMYAIVLHWTIVSIFIIIGFVGYIFCKETMKSTQDHKNVEICIVSKASKSVEGVLFECIRHNAKKFSNYTVNIIVDEGSELLSDIESCTKQLENIKLVVVPSIFKCHAIAKGRAIEYFIRMNVMPDKWYAFIDDDNLVLDTKFLREIPYYEKQGYVACNGILYPRLGRSKLTFVADSLRYFDDLTIFRFGTGMLRRPINGFHGELLVVKGECLKSITFDRETVTEDFAFSRELFKIKAKTWQSESIVSIQSPHSLTDFVKQRNRWYRGISGDVKCAPWQMKLFAGIRIIDWRLGLSGSWMIFPVWFLLPIPLWISLFNMIGASYYMMVYISGAMRLESGGLRSMVMIPLYGILEMISPHIRMKKKEFNVISK